MGPVINIEAKIIPILLLSLESWLGNIRCKIFIKAWLNGAEIKPPAKGEQCGVVYG
jgi:hypothetical protein